jgi:sugar/nucleoside kinase (ribokinase family)
VGILVADLFPSPIPRLPEAGELMMVDTIELLTGGCAANTAVALTKLGVSTGIIGKVGKDTAGRFIAEDLKSRGIDVSRIVESSGYETSKTLVLPVVDEDRRFIHHFGANADFEFSDIDLSFAASAKALYVGGYIGMPKFTEGDLVSLLKQVKSRGGMTFLDVIIPEPADYLPRFRNVLPHVDVFFPNDDEARLITGEPDPEKQAEIFIDLGAKTVIITLGSEGAVARSKDRLIRSGSYPIPFVDGAGAGDAFDAGFIAASLDGGSLEEAVKLASAMGASCVSALGCSAGLFDREESLSFMARHDLTLEITG